MKIKSDQNERRLTYLSPTGMLGAGFTEEHFLAALSPDLAFIGCDAGSSDGGAAFLGGDRIFISKNGVKRDIAILLKGARQLGIPLLIGSSGGSGSNWGLNGLFDIIKEVADEEDLEPFRTALIQAEPDRQVLIDKFLDGKIIPLDPAPPLDENVIRDAEKIVAMMGAEVFQSALENGAEVILAGRATDASIFSAIPLLEGFDPGLCWHAAKIMECGGASVTALDRPEGMICTLFEDRFVLEPVSPFQKCSEVSIASHALYETGDPFEVIEPGVILMLKEARYQALDDRCVAVSGSQFELKPYTVRLEGAELAGYESISIGGIRDPMLLRQYDSFLESALEDVERGVDQMFGRAMAGEYQLKLRSYGRDGVLGINEPLRDQIGHEIGLLITVVAATQEMADAITGLAAHRILHHAIPEWSGLISNLAFPLAPFVTSHGAVYRFVLNHAVYLDSPLELFSINYEEVGG